jgi:PleD family two-component response regulator
MAPRKHPKVAVKQGSRPALRLVEGSKFMAGLRPGARAWHPAQGRRRGPVLYVSGETDNRMVLARAIRRREAVKLVVAGNAHAGLMAAIDRRPRMVVVEARLSDGDAEDLVRTLRKQVMPSGAPIVVMAHGGTPTERARFIWAGATTYLSGTLHEGEIDRTVGRLLVGAPMIVDRRPRFNVTGAPDGGPPQRPAS